MNLLSGIWDPDGSGGAHMASLVPQEGSSLRTALVGKGEGRSVLSFWPVCPYLSCIYTHPGAGRRPEKPTSGG